MVEKHVLDTLDDHEGRIRALEVNDAKTSTKLDMTNKLLGAIAVMIGGGIVTVLFSILTHQIKIGG
jgi:hypothetical protein